MEQLQLEDDAIRQQDRQATLHRTLSLLDSAGAFSRPSSWAPGASKEHRTSDAESWRDWSHDNASAMNAYRSTASDTQLASATGGEEAIVYARSSYRGSSVHSAAAAGTASADGGSDEHLSSTRSNTAQQHLLRDPSSAREPSEVDMRRSGRTLAAGRGSTSAPLYARAPSERRQPAQAQQQRIGTPAQADTLHGALAEPRAAPDVDRPRAEEAPGLRSKGETSGHKDSERAPRTTKPCVPPQTQKQEARA